MRDLTDLSSDRMLDILDRVLGQARSRGADAADVLAIDRRSLSLSWRLGKQQSIERSESRDIGLRVFVGRRQAIVSTSDLSENGLMDLAERALAMARFVPEDPYCGLAAQEQIVAEPPDLDICDPIEPSIEVLRQRAATAEEAALAISGVTNSEGADSSWSLGRYSLAATNGLRRTFARSSHSLAISVLAGSGTAMERDYEYATSVFAEDLLDPTDLGVAAARRAVARLHPRKAVSAQLPVVFERRVANSLLSHFAQAINGASVARGTTFLSDKIETAVFSASINIIDDPLCRRGLRSRPFDSEGIAGRRRLVVEKGVLRSWLLDLRSARQIGARTTGHASRGVSSLPSPAPTNLYLCAGSLSPRRLIEDIDEGLYVTDLMGFGVNGITGDYSRGASGFWISKGATAHAVSEVTISGNLLDMFRALTPADDLEFRYGLDAPTTRVDGMTISGR